ncbi:MAG: hypothetical protein OJF51_001889 [Nitrospira sp.]|nr:MAG: hypothetical protein OJF51_001889 [Nitrospira sp.]
MRVCAAKEKYRAGQRNRQIGRVLLRVVTFVLAVVVVPATILSGCGGGGEGGGAGGSQAPFTVAAESSVSGTQGSGLLLPVDLTRHPGFTDTVTVTLDNPPAGMVADTIVFSGETASALLPITVTHQAALRNHSLNVIGKSGSASHMVPVTLSVGAAQPMAQQKIVEALQAGKLDYGTSLLYRAYALFGDRRLPSEYQGPSLEEDNLLFDEIRQALGTFSSNMQARLQPFIVRPADPASVWNVTTPTAPGAAMLREAPQFGNVLAIAPPAQCPLNQAGGWASKRSAAHPVRVWAKCHGVLEYDAKSQELIDQALAVLDKIYEPMTKWMGPPLLDQDGGDDAIDFYILGSSDYVFRRNKEFLAVAMGVTYSDSPEEDNSSSGFVILQRDLANTPSFHSTIIHEFFHVLQTRHNDKYQSHRIASGVDVFEKHWFVEASATWAEAHFDLTLKPWVDGRAAYFAVHTLFEDPFQISSKGLNAVGIVGTNASGISADLHPYSAYIWPHFVEQEKKDKEATFMGQIWVGLEAVTTFEQADDVIDSVYSFADNFKTFALRNLNQEYVPGDPLPKTERYVSLDPDQFPDGVGPKFLPENGLGSLKADLENSYPLELDTLSARYVRLLALDQKIQKVEFDFSQLQPAGFTDVQALVSTTTGWVSKPLDLGSGKTTFCFDTGPTTTEVRGSFDDIRLVVANHAKREKVSGALVVRPQSKPCTPVWTGRFVQRATVLDYTFTAEATFEFDDTAPQVPGTIPYRLRSGNYSYTSPASDTGGCIDRARAGGPMRPGWDPNIGGSTGAALTIYTTTRPYKFFLIGKTVVDGTQTPCVGKESRLYAPEFTWGLVLPGQNGVLEDVVSDDGNTIQGSRDISNGGIGYHLAWQFTKSGE